MHAAELSISRRGQAKPSVLTAFLKSTAYAYPVLEKIQMKTLPYVNAAVLAIASVLLPQLDALPDAYRWTQANLSSWLCSKRLVTKACRNV